MGHVGGGSHFRGGGYSHTYHTTYHPTHNYHRPTYHTYHRPTTTITTHSLFTYNHSHGQHYSTPVAKIDDAKTLFLREVDSSMYKMNLATNTMEFFLDKNPTQRQMELLGNYIEGIEWASPTFTGVSSDGRWTAFTATKFLRQFLYRGIAGVQVTVLKAENLDNKDSGKKGDVSDPFVVVSLSGTKGKFKTPVVKDNLNPEWNTSNLLPVDGDYAAQTLHFKVMDKDLILDDTLGSASLPLKDALLSSIVSHFTLDILVPKKDSNSHGKLYVTIDGINCGGDPIPEVVAKADAAPKSAVVLIEGTELPEAPQ